MHPNTENSFRINFANTMFGFLMDILPLDTGVEEENEEGGGKPSGGNIVDEKMLFI